MTDAHSSTPAHPGLPWLLIAGLASLALLWPLTALIGIPSGAPRAIALIAVIAAVWIGVVGFARIPNPVTVLALVGIGYGAIMLIVSALFGGGDRPIWTYAVALATDAFWGVMAGLLALAVQAMIGPRRDVR